MLGKIPSNDVLGSVGAAWLTGYEDTTVQSNYDLWSVINQLGLFLVCI